MKSVKEIAEICNVSKQAIFNQIKSHNIKTTKVKNVAYIMRDEDIEKLLNHFNKDRQAEDKALDEVMTEITMFKKDINRNKQVDKSVVNLISNDKDSSSKEVAEQLKLEIKILTSQLESERQLTSILTKQNEHDKKQITDLTRIVENQQILALESGRKVKELETELNEVRLKLDQSESIKAGEIEEFKTVVDDKEVQSNNIKNNPVILMIAYDLIKKVLRR